jgi:hypothetical protein
VREVIAPAILPDRAGGRKARKEAVLFGKKRTKKLLFDWIPAAPAVNEQTFSVSFFQRRNTSLLPFISTMPASALAI